MGRNVVNNGFNESPMANRPIGILKKNYDYIKDALKKGIGDGNHNNDGYGSPIGSVVSVDEPRFAPWYMTDKKKQNTSNYLEYLGETYYDRSGIENNFIPTSSKVALIDYDKMTSNEVGAVRGYSIHNIPHTLSGDNIQTNPNSWDDTRLGAVNNYFLNASLYYSRKLWNKRQEMGLSITSGAYSRFGFDGDFGLNNGDVHMRGDRVLTQSELMGDTIPWSTADHNYNSYTVGSQSVGNLQLMKNIFNLSDDDDSLSYDYTDNVKSSNLNNLYYPFGNFYDITYSLGMNHASSEMTKKFIAKSMFGYDLLSDVDVDLDYNKDSVHSMSRHPKKYYAGNGTRGTNYIDAMSGSDVRYVKRENSDIRLEFPDMGNDSLWSTKYLYTYGEHEGSTGEGSSMKQELGSWNGGTNYGSHAIYLSGVTSTKKDIVHYTNMRFLKGEYDTLISRFHTDEIGIDGARSNRDITSTAVSRFGQSHGRNLLKANLDDIDTNGYSNPYCRVWTYHHQYSTLNDTIRSYQGDFKAKFDGDDSVIKNYRTDDGINKLNKYGVKSPTNGLVLFAPTDDNKGENSVKRCMFSIENLAWKGEKNFFKGREEQKGPLGGRIMWFPPYGLRFNESVNVDWGRNQFIGRGESIYTYTNTERGGTLNFKLLIDHPSIINQWRSKGTDEGIGDVDDIKSKEQTLLRFFAGCEILQGFNPKYEEGETEPKPKMKKVVRKVEIPVIVEDELVFYVFYPNNYSGFDDSAGGVVKPMEYLINGLGASKMIDQNGKIVDMPTTLSSKGKGYEMGSQNGISEGVSKSISGKSITNVSQYVKSNKIGNPNYWKYRCDNDYEKQVLSKVDGKSDANYSDTKSFELNNTKGYAKLLEYHTNDKETYNNGRLFSFADVFCAIQPEAKDILSGEYDEESVNIITDILGLKKKNYNITQIEVKGFASNPGYKASNNTLGKNRADSVSNWLNHCYPNKFPKENDYKTNEIGKGLTHDVNCFIEKVTRCARVAIKIQKEDIQVFSETVDVPIKIDENMVSNITYASNMTDADIKDVRNIATESNSQNAKQFRNAIRNEYGRDPSNLEYHSTVNQIEENRAIAEVEGKEVTTKGDAAFLREGVNYGYRAEHDFFTNLEANEPLMHHKLVDKIKYFDPAFHSITPEGFQARLTFLHQCTRQGNTVADSDVNPKTANNLAFGRPPICVLRIGDFFNTKIIIDSLQIDYDETTWDLNPEGIGVMPMMANISIGFKFLGGSDLSGPINRLQNALSFNHYANTSVYDSRAEEISYDSNGDVNKFKLGK